MQFIDIKSAARFALIAAALFNTACGGGSSDGEPSESASCRSDAECGADEYCAPSQSSQALSSSTHALVDEECLMACEGECEGDACDLCEVACGGTPACDDCGSLCAVAPGGDQAACVAQCEAVCEGDDSPGGELPGGELPGGEAPAGGVPGGGGGAQATGVCRAKAPAANDDDDQDEQPAAKDVEWAGVWQVRVEYDVVCDLGLAGTREGSQSFQVSGRMTGSNDDLSIVFDPDYEMTGSGRNERLSLSGRFPARNHDNKPASRTDADNNVTITLESVADENSASGRIEGTFRTAGFSGECSINNGTVSFSR